MEDSRASIGDDDDTGMYFSINLLMCEEVQDEQIKEIGEN